MLITVEGTTNTATLQGAVTVKAAGAHITALDNTATFDPDWSNIPVDKATFIQTINGVGPDGQGNFFLSGSECDSWGYIVGGTATDAGYKDGEGQPLPDPVVVTSGSTYSKSGIWITDLCPACSACEMLYRLKQEVIRMKLWLAVLRDVNLYQQHLNDARQTGTTELTEAEWLWNRRFPAAPDCGAYILGSTFSQFAEDEQFAKGLQLIQQYITTVHMWNYLVNRNNKSDVISIAPEDTAGFVVQTKRSVTSCHETQQVRCTIKVLHAEAHYDDGHVAELMELMDSYPVSVFVPRAVLEFQPFTKSEADVGIPAAVPDPSTGVTKNITVRTVNEADDDYDDDQRGEHESDYEASDQAKWSDKAVYCRVVDTGIISAVAAGTYVVTAKFLPFVYSVMVNSEGEPISLRGTTDYSISGTTAQDGSIVFQFFARDTTPTPVAEPTSKEYLEAKTAPTVSVNFKIMWVIKITWEVTGEETSLEEQTYYYMCNGIRRYYSESVIAGSTISGGTVTPETTNA